VRSSLRFCLESDGARVLGVATPSGAFEALERSRFDAVFLDLWLGRDSGLDVLPEIREIMAILHDARSRRDGWPKTMRVDEAARLAALLRVVPVLELASIDWSFDPYFYSYSYPAADAHSWLRLFESHASVPDSWAWFAVSTLDRSGFVRQAAVEKCLKRFMPIDLFPSLEVALQGEARVTGPRGWMAHGRLASC
jgi:hypothetical protein